MTTDALALLREMALSITIIILFCGLLQNLLLSIQIVIAYRSMRRRVVEQSSLRAGRQLTRHAPAITLIVPAFNEAVTIVSSVQSLLALDYPDMEVVVVNDGSTDGTSAALIDRFDMTPTHRTGERLLKHAKLTGCYVSRSDRRLILISKENGGKADALNAGICATRSPLFCAIDADTILEPDALLRLVQPFVDDPGRTIAAGGTVRIVNGCEVKGGRVTRPGLPPMGLVLFQVVEYLRAFQAARLAWSKMGSLTIISGAFGLFRTASVIDAGGYRRDTVGEDYELVVRLHRLQREKGHSYSIVFLPDAICWTQAPETIAGLSQQRSRWQRGALETFARHRDTLFSARHGRIGMAAIPNTFVVDVAGPLVEALGYVLLPTFWAAGLLRIEYLFAFVTVTVTFGIFVSVASLAIAEMELKRAHRARDLTKLVAGGVLENVGYRQLNNLWRVQGWWQWLNRKADWGVIRRETLGDAT